MIIKFFEIKKNNLTHTNLILLYGKNEGLIEETIKNYSAMQNHEIFDLEKIYLNGEKRRD